MLNWWKALAVFTAAAASLGAASFKIVVVGSDRSSWSSDDHAMAAYKSAAPNAQIVLARTAADVSREVVDADGIIGGVTKDQFATAKKLKWVQTYSAGVEQYRWREFLDSDVTLTNCKIVQGPNIADHAFAMLLALTRGLYRYIPGRTSQEWSRDEAGLTELKDMTAVVIGVGGIGSQIAQRAHGFGMKVIGVDPKDIAPGAAVSKIVTPDHLDEVLPLADVVFVSAPLTPQSRHMMGPKQFELMKKDTYFIAVSRGGLYDTPALVKALDSKRLAGAGLDVTEPEPLPKGHALWNFQNVIITPHIAGQSPGSFDRRLGVIKENLGRFTRGERMVNIVDKQRGF
jgi:D-2-hydroxyacid dehydrogenase (NADP+)